MLASERAQQIQTLPTKPVASVFSLQCMHTIAGRKKCSYKLSSTHVPHHVSPPPQHAHIQSTYKSTGEFHA